MEKYEDCVSNCDIDKKETRGTNRKGAIAYLWLPDSPATVVLRQN